MLSLSLLPVLLFLGLGYVRARSALQTEVLRHMESLASAKALGTELLLKERLSDAQVVARRVGLRQRVSNMLTGGEQARKDARRQLSRDLEDLTRIYGHYGGALIVVPATNEVLVSYGRWDETTLMQHAAAASKEAAPQDTTARLSPVYTVGPQQKPALNVVASIPAPGQDDPQAPAIALLVLQVDLDHCLFPFLDDRVGMGETGEVVLLDENGRAIKNLRHDPHALLHRTISTLPAYRATRGQTGTVVARDYCGKPVLAAYHHIDLPKWGLVVQIDQKEAYGPLARLLGTFLGLTAVLTACAGTIAFGFARQIATPIVKLANTAQRLANGDMMARVQPQGNDEIAVLGREFNQMADEITATRMRLEERIEQRTAELHQIQERLALALDSGNIGTWEFWPQTGVATFDEQTHRLVGYSYAELPPRMDTLWQLAHPDDMSRVRSALEDCLLGNAPSAEGEFRMRCQSGEWRWYYASGKVVERGLHGSPQRVIGILIDITERKALQEQLQRAARLEAVGTLAGGIAHDFNNLLTGISGYAQMARQTVTDGSQTASDLEQILNLAQRAARLTRQLLAFSRRQTLEPTVLNINVLVEDMTKMLRRIIGEDIELRFYPASDLGNTYADAGQIEQVVMNLAVNARDAMPHGGILTIETQNIELSREYEESHVEVQAGSYVMLAISDTGSGMDEQTKARIFEPFFTTKGLGRGTGLGLAVVHGIVKQHHGHITCYSEPGAGTTFKVYLPRVDVDVPQHTPMTPENLTLAGNETVLLVEDDDAVRLVAQRALEVHGYTVLSCANVGEALKRFSTYAEEISLLLTDVVLSDGSGKDLYSQLWMQRSDLKVLYMSGYTVNTITHHSVLDPGTPFIQKPFTPQSLAQRVRQVLNASSSALPSS
ncbi:MAG: ATP-binding protein [Candidatus Zipacnadales bacterium]